MINDMSMHRNVTYCGQQHACQFLQLLHKLHFVLDKLNSWSSVYSQSLHSKSENLLVAEVLCKHYQLAVRQCTAIHQGTRERWPTSVVIGCNDRTLAFTADTMGLRALGNTDCLSKAGDVLSDSCREVLLSVG